MLESLLNKVSGLSQMFFEIGVLKNFANFTVKHLCWSLFLIKFQAWTLLKGNSNTDVFLWNLRNSLEHLFYRTPPVGASGNRKTFPRLSIFYYHDLANCSVHSAYHDIIKSFLAAFSHPCAVVQFTYWQ